MTIAVRRSLWGSGGRSPVESCCSREQRWGPPLGWQLDLRSRGPGRYWADEALAIHELARLGHQPRSQARRTAPVQRAVGFANSRSLAHQVVGIDPAASR